MKTQKQLAALIAIARTQQARGTLKAHTPQADDTASTNSWGPAMRV